MSASRKTSALPILTKSRRAIPWDSEGSLQSPNPVKPIPLPAGADSGKDLHSFRTRAKDALRPIENVLVLPLAEEKLSPLPAENKARRKKPKGEVLAREDKHSVSVAQKSSKPSLRDNRYLSRRHLPTPGATISRERQDRLQAILSAMPMSALVPTSSLRSASSTGELGIPNPSSARPIRPPPGDPTAISLAFSAHYLTQSVFADNRPALSTMSVANFQPNDSVNAVTGSSSEDEDDDEDPFYFDTLNLARISPPIRADAAASKEEADANTPEAVSDGLPTDMRAMLSELEDLAAELKGMVASKKIPGSPKDFLTETPVGDVETPQDPNVWTNCEKGKWPVYDPEELVNPVKATEEKVTETSTNETHYIYDPKNAPEFLVGNSASPVVQTAPGYHSKPLKRVFRPQLEPDLRKSSLPTRIPGRPSPCTSPPPRYAPPRARSHTMASAQRKPISSSQPHRRLFDSKGSSRLPRTPKRKNTIVVPAEISIPPPPTSKPSTFITFFKRSASAAAQSAPADIDTFDGRQRSLGKGSRIGKALLKPRISHPNLLVRKRAATCN